MTEVMNQAAPSAPDARLLVAPGCAHCPRVIDGLSRLLKAGQIGRLEIVNIAAHPNAAREAGARSVPWFTIGPFTLTGAHSHAELAEWTRHAAEGSGLTAYFRHLIEDSRLESAVAMLRRGQGSLQDLIPLLGDPDTPMNVRIGIGAVLEDFADTPELASVVDSLATLAESEQPQIRADACHYLGLARSPAALPVLRACLEDDDAEVREIAAESLAMISP